MSTKSLGLLGVAVALGACGEKSPTSRTNVAVSVAPLELSGVTNARYTITVTAGGNTVWTAAVDADRYGDGRGGIAYVGPCDASAEVQPNTITLVLEALEDDGGDIPAGTWQNPTPVAQTFDCVENQDTRVPFDLVIMRDAKQGFFDVAVDFEDVFCSAKFDCQDNLLHNAGEHDLTGVLAFACTAGPGQSTTLHLTDVTLSCDGQPDVVVDPSIGPGQRPASGTLFAVGTYWGTEQLPGLDKCYWNTALGLDLEPASAGPVNPHNCKVHALGTASDGPLEAAATPALTRYPIIEWAVPVTDANGTLTCGTHPLNGPDGTVKTRYSDLAGESLPHPLVCGGNPARTCTGSAPTVDGSEVSIADLGDGALRVQIGGVWTEVQLPANTTFEADAGCCIDPCCDTGAAP